MSEPVTSMETERFALVARRETPRIVAKLTGTADQAIAVELGEAFRAIHVAVANGGITEAVLDLRGLEFMSSACIKALLTWIGDIQDLEPDRRYSLELVSSAAHHWQKRSLNTVRCFATDLVRVTTEE